MRGHYKKSSGAVFQKIPPQIPPLLKPLCLAKHSALKNHGEHHDPRPKNGDDAGHSKKAQRRGHADELRDHRQPVHQRQATGRRGLPV